MAEADSLKGYMTAAKTAHAAYAKFSQQQVDHIVCQMAIAANQARIRLAQHAVAETGMGVVEDKVIKITLLLNIFITNTDIPKLVILLNMMNH